MTTEHFIYYYFGIGLNSGNARGIEYLYNHDGVRHINVEQSNVVFLNKISKPFGDVALDSIKKATEVLNLYNNTHYYNTKTINVQSFSPYTISEIPIVALYSLMDKYLSFNNIYSWSKVEQIDNQTVTQLTKSFEHIVPFMKGVYNKDVNSCTIGKFLKTIMYYCDNGLIHPVYYKDMLFYVHPGLLLDANKEPIVLSTVTIDSLHQNLGVKLYINSEKLNTKHPLITKIKKSLCNFSGNIYDAGDLGKTLSSFSYNNARKNLLFGHKPLNDYSSEVILTKDFSDFMYKIDE